MASANVIVLKLSRSIQRNVIKCVLGAHRVPQHIITQSMAFSDTSKANENSVTLSDSCVKQIHKIGEKDKYLRLSVEGGGCSGFQYTFSLDSEVTAEDKVFEKDGAKLVVDEMSLEYVKGSIVDYQEEMIRSAFQVVANPIAEKACSCGTSFSIKI
ncbi:iron-sulfur cluster assembly 2 homolog, mitochondrial-like [Anneissia japonica]|uniref:iron-sulfur cluster assembly 2 homolog, mitochondrial-like n=1 Tax=Anneissia japonica TaxID=1529436 RepID=UPI001425576A|nr:iron-sulfur cluster assembly 2 homolog, mitochondrial-like [Anneissia japonica]